MNYFSDIDIFLHLSQQDQESFSDFCLRRASSALYYQIRKAPRTKKYRRKTQKYCPALRWRSRLRNGFFLKSTPQKCDSPCGYRYWTHRHPPVLHAANDEKVPRSPQWSEEYYWREVCVDFIPRSIILIYEFWFFHLIMLVLNWVFFVLFQ